MFGGYPLSVMEILKNKPNIYQYSALFLFFILTLLGPRLKKSGNIIL